MNLFINIPHLDRNFVQKSLLHIVTTSSILSLSSALSCNLHSCIKTCYDIRIFVECNLRYIENILNSIGNRAQLLT